MRKIKLFRYKMSNYAYTITSDKPAEALRYQKASDKLAKIETIEKEINNFIKDKHLVDIKINNIDVNYHNNGYNNNIELLYTVIYEEKTETK